MLNCLAEYLSIFSTPNPKFFKDEILNPKKKFDKEDIVWSLFYEIDRYILELDTVIIAIGFGQLIKEGKIEKEYKPYLERSIIRTYYPSSYSKYEEVKPNPDRMKIFLNLMEILKQA